MTGYTKSANPKCVLCTSESRSELETRIHSGEISPSEVADFLGCTDDQVFRHMTHHLQPLVQQSAANLIAQKEVNEIDTLSNNINRLEAKVDELFAQDALDPKYIDSLTKLAKEIRESLKYLMEFKGKLVHKRQDTIIVAQMQVVQEVLAQNNPEIWIEIKKRMQEKLQ